MSNIKLEKEDIYNNSIAPIPETGTVLIGIGLDGNLKKKDSFGIVSNIDSGETGATGISGIDGGNTTRWDFSSNANNGQFTYSNVVWGNVGDIYTLTLNSISVNSVNSYNWLSVLDSSVTTPDTSILKIEEVGNSTNFAFFTIQDVTDNGPTFTISVRLTSTGSNTAPVIGNTYGISSISSGAGGGEQDNYVRTLYINKADLSFNEVISYEQSICNYILALPEEERTIADTDSKWNIVVSNSPLTVYESFSIGVNNAISLCDPTPQFFPTQTVYTSADPTNFQVGDLIYIDSEGIELLPNGRYWKNTGNLYIVNGAVTEYTCSVL